MIDKFINKWKNKKYVEGMLLTGSYVTGYYTKNSDIDIYIILSDEINWRERGNLIINGTLIEYFANPVRQIRSYFKKEFEKHEKITARMFVIGKIIFDKNGIVTKLKKEAEKWLKKPFKKLSKVEIELIKYSLWDSFDELKTVSEEFNFKITYYTFLEKVLRSYCKFLGIEVPPISKINKYLDKNYRAKYCYPEFPDKDFMNLFMKCLEKEDLNCVEKLYYHVINKLGGFDIKNWKLRSKIDI
jgi:predicted nucleotidyltransferase